MFDKLGSALKQPFYVWLLGIYPILHLYSENLGLVNDREVLRVCGVMLAATILAFLVANRVIPCRHKAAFMLSVCSLVFSLSGHLYMLVFAPRSLFLWSLFWLIALAILLLILWRSASSQVFEPVTPALNLILLVLLAIPGTKIVSSYLSKSINVQPVSAYGNPSTAEGASPKVYDSSTHPDIYYIIPDGYLKDSLLREAVAFDNSAFTQALEDRGFIVVEHAQSNYNVTLHSIASILNMQYFDNNPSPYTDLDFLRFAITDNEVGRLLKQFGYTYVQFLSGFWMPSPTADITRDFTPGGTIAIEVNQNNFSSTVLEDLPKNRKVIPDLAHYYKQSFAPLYLETTLLRIVSARLYAAISQDDSEPYGLYAPGRFLDTVDEVELVARMPEATFTVIHLLKPHLPIVFDEVGEFLPADWHPSNDKFIAQHKFVNSMFLEMIDTILQESRNPPVIMFQADHGAIYVDGDEEFRKLVHFSPYVAYRLPGFHSISFPKPFTLINSFPLLFNEIFEANYEVNDDRLFDLPLGYKAPFEQRDVTARYLGK